MCTAVPEAQDLGAAAAMALLEACIRCTKVTTTGSESNLASGQMPPAVSALFALPCFQQLSAAVVHESLNTAIVREHIVVLQWLVQLPAAAELAVRDVLQLLRNVVSGGHRGTLTSLWGLAACKHIAPGAVVELFHLVVMRGLPEVADDRLPVADTRQKLMPDSQQCGNWTPLPCNSCCNL